MSSKKERVTKAYGSVEIEPENPLATAEEVGPFGPVEWGPGDVLGQQFQLVRKLGEGGMGKVFLAKDLALGRRVAIKTIKPPSMELGYRRFVQMFRRDAASTARLHHPHIVSLFQFGFHEGAPFLVLEYIKGQSLRELLGQGPLSPEQGRTLAQRLAEALEYAHKQGVIHRDLKPENLMLTPEGALKVLDFGVAMMRLEMHQISESFGLSEEEFAQVFGEVSQRSGSPLYMAPEQTFGVSQDERVDIWGFGLVVFESLTGALPFKSQRSTLPEVSLDGILSLDLPGSFVKLLGACLSLDPQHRPADFSQVLRVLGEATQPRWRAPVRRERKRQLVAPSNAFVGRLQPLAELSQRLIADALPMVTLVGPGGVGKTRLVIEWALQQREAFDDVVFCDLTESHSGEAVLSALAQALELPLTGKQPEAALHFALEQLGQSLLILDNCEQVLEALVALVEPWLESLPSLRFLLTSREPLQLASESVLRLMPLEQSAHNQEALSLFVHRAMEASTTPRHELDLDREALAALAKELDGLPLAIELAASRLKVMPAEKMLTRMHQRFKLLRSQQRDLTPRQATLRGSLEWSWELLAPHEREAFAQLSAFEGGFSLEGAEEVVGLDDFDDAPFVMDVVESLVDKSLLQVQEGRFGMLVSIHSFARQKRGELASEAALRARHGLYFAGFGQEQYMQRCQQAPALFAELAAELDNLQVALDWALETGDASVAAPVVCAMSLVYSRLGPVSLGLKRAEEVLQTLAEVLAPGLKLRVLLESSELHRLQGRYPETVARLEEALGLSRALELRRQEGRCLSRLGTAYRFWGKREQAQAYLEEALAIAQSEGDPLEQSICLERLGQIALISDRIDDAVALTTRAMEIAAQHEAPLPLCDAKISLAYLRFIRGQYTACQDLTQQAMTLAHQLQDQFREARCISTMANLSLSMGPLEQAEYWFEQSLQRVRQLGQSNREETMLGFLGLVARLQGRYPEARAFIDEALSLAQRRGHRFNEGLMCFFTSMVTQSQGLLDETRRWCQRTQELAQETGNSRVEKAVLGTLGLVILEEGDEQGFQLLEQALSMAQDIGSKFQTALWLCQLGLAHGRRGDLEQAQQRLQEVLELLSELRVTCESEPGQLTTALAELLSVPLPPETFLPLTS